MRYLLVRRMLWRKVIDAAYKILNNYTTTYNRREQQRATQ